MRQICLDFRNRKLAIRTNSQDGTEYMYEDIQKTLLLDFIPKRLYMQGDNFTLDFENEKVYVNKSFHFDNAGGAIYTVDMFKPESEHPVPGLAEAFHKVLDRMGYAETQWNEKEMDYLNTLEFFANMGFDK